MSYHITNVTFVPGGLFDRLTSRNFPYSNVLEKLKVQPFNRSLL